mgnify:CR=1 FL=1
MERFPGLRSDDRAASEDPGHVINRAGPGLAPSRVPIRASSAPASASAGPVSARAEPVHFSASAEPIQRQREASSARARSQFSASAKPVQRQREASSDPPRPRLGSNWAPTGLQLGSNWAGQSAWRDLGRPKGLVASGARGGSDGAPAARSDRRCRGCSNLLAARSAIADPNRRPPPERGRTERAARLFCETDGGFGPASPMATSWRGRIAVFSASRTPNLTGD